MRNSFRYSHRDGRTENRRAKKQRNSATKLEFITIPPHGGGWASHVVLVVKNPPANAGDIRDAVSIPGEGTWQPTPVSLPGESHGWRSLAGYSA